MKPCLESTHGNKGEDGYYRFKHGRVSDEYFVHRWVFKTHNGELSSTEQIRHLCDNRGCIEPTHLLKGSAQDNQNDKVQRNRQARGRKISLAKLYESDVKDIFKLYRADVSVTELADRFDVATSTICAVLDRRTWKHVEIK